MSCFRLRSPEDITSSKIDSDLRAARRKDERKLLLLGPGESGKSTVFKQMKIIQDGGGFSDAELIAYRNVICSNCISEMRELVLAAQNLQIPILQENFQIAQDFLKLKTGGVWSAEIGMTIKKLWADPAIKELYNKPNKSFHINDTAEYFFNNIDRFIQPNFVPTSEDVVRVRVRSTGIEEAEFCFDKMIFKVVDVGGQRSERRKWIHCFDCVIAVLFCASLSEYDQFLREEQNTNRMEEALNLFEDVVNSSHFRNSAMILFLNKTDKFMEKLQISPLNKTFPNYTGGSDYAKATAFIESRFRERVTNGIEVFHHFTCAIETENIKYVIFDVRKKVLTNICKDIAI